MKILSTASDLVAQLGPQMTVFVHGACCTPVELLKSMVAQSQRFNNLELIHLHTFGPADYARPEYAGHFKVTNLFVGSNIRPYLDYDRVDYLPCFLSEIPQLFRSGRKKIDACLIQVSPPDKHGYCSLGTSVDVVRAAIESSSLVLAQINSNVPRVLGDGIISVEDIDYAVELNTPLIEHGDCEIGEVELKIGSNVGQLIQDGSTLQLGIGSVPDAVCRSLINHRDLGLHTEMWSEEALNLIKLGVINNKHKKIHPGKSVGSFVMGTKKMFDFINDNPSVLLLDSSYVNNPTIIARNPKVVAINSAVELDLSGQVCADSIGPNVISGVGGQMDFMRGASLSPGGKPILAITSRSKKGVPRIVAQLKNGAGVVTTRSHVHYVVTEYGAVDLYGKSLGDRAKALISISHPQDRELLESEWFRIHRKGQ